MEDRKQQLLAKLDELGGKECYRQSTKSVWDAAFVLYRRHYPRNRMRVGCDSCRATVYNWLRNA